MSGQPRKRNRGMQVGVWFGALGLVVLCWLVLAGVALAGEGPRWQVTVSSEPTHVVPGSPGAGVLAPELRVVATNVGGAASNGSTVTLSDTLGGGLTATKVVGVDTYASGFASNGVGFAAAELSCAHAPVVSCTDSRSVDPGDQLVMTVTFSAAAVLGEEAIANTASVSGGGPQPASSATPIVVSETPAEFGPASESVMAALSSSEAGAHPDLTTAFTLATRAHEEVPADLKDVRFDLPPGLVGSTVGMPRCTMNKVIEEQEHPGLCPADSMVGMATLTLTEKGTGLTTDVTPVYNIAPSPGEPAAFAFDAVILPVRLDTSVLSNGDYGIRVTAPSLPEAAQTISTWVTIWGVPAEHSGPGNDLTEADAGHKSGSFGGVDPSQSRVPLLTNPQQCSEPLVATMSADSWVHQGEFVSEQAAMGTMTGCDLVPFSSSFTFLPDTLEAAAPAGYTFNLDVPQSNEPGVLATSSLKDLTLTLPEGTVVNPSAAWGLRACSTAQFYGPNHPSQEPASPAGCPREAQVGEVEVETPDLEKPLKGEVYLGTPECEPCTPSDAEEGRMVRLFVQLVGEGEAGVVVKLEGHADINQQTGQITTVFQNTPEVPFNKLHFVLEGGPRAVLANPRSCGPVKTSGDLTPWSTGVGVSDSTPTYEFEIRENCFGAQFNPTFVAGTTNIQAGEYSPFTLSFGRSDEDEYLGRLEQTMPPGLLGDIGTVTLCKEPQASEGTCPQSSLIGHVQVLTGPGADPFLVTGGQVFMTEGYEGAPYGLSIVVPAVAGPYTLSGTTGQGTVVVRAKILVDPTDAHLTVISDPLPSMLDGIPLQLRVVNVTIDRPGFTFNPTNCAKQQIAATLTSTQGTTAQLASPFQVTNCADLKFTPSFTASTSGKTSRLDGASLHVALSFPAESQGKQANIHQVKVELPKQLPSQLKTLQKACTAAQFAADPAGCPASSIVGHARATTPILPVALEGPAYFVSHGGEAFPSLEIVLQGYGVTVDLTGSTFINEKTGITSSTFKTVPDVPVGTFELTLPEQQYPALAANGDLCTAKKLAMPTEFLAQNGARLTQSTKIQVTGCPKTKAKKKRHKHEDKRPRHKRKANRHKHPQPKR